MPEIGTVTTQIGERQNTSATISTDESIGGILFDISGFNNPFDNHLLISNSFGSQQVQLINNLEEASNYGLDDSDFLNGLVYYHLSMFYDYIGGNAPLYIAFADCSSNWDYIYTMQRLCGGKMFQLGIWTSQPIWRINNNVIEFTRLIPDIKVAVEELTGIIGQPSQSTIPLNVILSANTNDIGGQTISLKKIPNATIYNAPKISVLLCQDGSDEVDAIQSNLPSNAPVGSIGLALAALNLAYAEENIGAVAKFNLNKNDKFKSPEIPVGGLRNKLTDSLKTTQNILASYGYIVPVSYESKEGEYFFSGDYTLSNGDYKNIANNRVMHKCRRAVYMALFPYIYSNHLYDNALKGLSNVAVQILEESIGAALTGKLINKEGRYQINGYNITIIESDNILNDDKVSINYTIEPVNYNDKLSDSIYIE